MNGNSGAIGAPAVYRQFEQREGASFFGTVALPCQREFPRTSWCGGRRGKVIACNRHFGGIPER
jgi:hypothetical protein